jgi:hypothetical protein
MFAIIAGFPENLFVGFGVIKTRNSIFDQPGAAMATGVATEPGKPSFAGPSGKPS